MNGSSRPDLPERGAIEAWRRHLGEEVDPDGLMARLSEGSLPRAFNETATRYPERAALTIGGETVTHGDLDRLAARAGGWIREQGVDAGERVVLCGGNSLDLVVGYLGILRAGAVVSAGSANAHRPRAAPPLENSGAVGALAQAPALEKMSSISRRTEVGLGFVSRAGGWGGSSPPALRRAISDAEPLEPRDDAAERDRVARLHLGHHGTTQGRAALARQFALLDARRDVGVAVGPGRRARARAAALPPARPRRDPRHAPLRLPRRGAGAGSNRRPSALPSSRRRRP